MAKIRIALIGIGKICRDRHLPALAANGDYDLVAGVSRNHTIDAVPNFVKLGDLLAAVPDLDAVSICTPPQVRFAIAQEALQSGLHVMLEKPPGATLNEVDALATLAAARRSCLFTSWHSREAAGVEPARRLLADEHVHEVRVVWKEDVRVWHPGQTWIWQAGGLGVFDPGINALSIVTRILPQRLRLTDARLFFPSNCETPIAAELEMLGDRGANASVSLDFLYTGEPVWQIEVEYGHGERLRLSRGGAVLQVNDDAPVQAADEEYPSLYRRFADLVREGICDVDTEPLKLVADAFLCGRRTEVRAFIE